MNFISWLFDTKWKKAHPLLVNEWLHIVCTYDGSKPSHNSKKMYVEAMDVGYHDKDDLRRVGLESFSIAWWQNKP